MSELLLSVFGIAVILNLLFFIIAYFLQTDKLTDMTYSLTFIAIAVAGYFSSEKNLVHLIVLTLILLWAIRLGSFLMSRVHRLGREDRFDNIRPYPIKFLGFWTVQAVTCFIVSLAALFIFSDGNRPLDFWFYIGSILSAIGLLIESVADMQKYRYKNLHPEKFMNKGLWKSIRHPNYSGEILFWLGLSICAIGSPLGFLGIISPIWISFILIRFSGIPILKKKWALNYGDQKAYQEYLEKSYNLIPFIY